MPPRTAGIGEFEEESEHTQTEENVGHVRITQDLEEPFDERHLDRNNLGIVRAEGDLSSTRGHGSAIHGIQESRKRRGHEIDDVLSHRLLSGDVDGFADRLLRPVSVATAPLRQAADLGDGIVDDFPLHRVVWLRGLPVLADEDWTG